MRTEARFAVVIAALFLLSFADRASGQGVLLVDDDASPGGDGLDWGTALDDLEPALAIAAAPGSGIAQIWVAEGTYVPSLRVDLAVPRSATFTIPAGVEIFGGFSGSESSLEERDWEAHPTVLSGDLAGDDLPGFVGVDENAYHVLRAIGIFGSALDGFTVTGGYALATSTGPLQETDGGGLFVQSSELTLRNCVFSANTSNSDGGAIRFSGAGSVLTIEDSDFIGNRSLEGYAGAIDCTPQTTLVVRGSLFSGNTCDEKGGAISARNGALTVEECEFIDNFALRGGGCIRTSSVTLLARGCLFENGSSTQTGGGAIFSEQGTATFVSCAFIGCQTGRSGGAIQVGGTVIAIWSSLLLGNSAGVGAGAIQVGGGTLSITNSAVLANSSGPDGAAITLGQGGGMVSSSTIAGNASLGPAGGLWSGQPGTQLVVRNSILWENAGSATTTEKRQLSTDRGAGVQIASSLVHGWTGLLGGAGNSGLDPLFVDAEGRFGPGSPALDGGDAASLPQDPIDLDLDGDLAEPLPLDLDGGPRLVGTLDIGPYEEAGPCVAPLTVDCDSNGVPDECDPDCNGNAIADACDIAASASSDADADGVPDECQPDCNSNGIADSWDVSSGSSADCDADGVPDECQAVTPWPAYSGVDPSFPPGSYSVDEGTLALGGDTIAVGVSNADGFGTNAGMVVILEPSGAEWASTAVLSSSPPVVEGGFGDTVAMSGTFLIVGANTEPDPIAGDDAGAAYIFERVGGSWVQVQRLQPSDPQENAFFGCAVDIDGDVAVVGADGQDGQRGRIYVFRRAAGVWAQEAALVPADIEAVDRFGGIIALDGEWIIARTLDDDQGSGAGAAYLFRDTGTGWSEHQKLTPGDLDDLDEFGRAVDVRGGFALIGATGKDDTAVNSGVAYVYTYDGIEWRLEDKLRPAIQPPNERFGRTVSLAETAHGPIALVATTGGILTGPPHPGLVYTYHRLHGVWRQAAMLQGSPAGVSDYFGYAIATDGDRAVVAAPLVAAEAGALHLFHGLGLADCDLDGVDDRCQIAAGLGADCNGNGFLDECDIAAGDSADADGDGVPDECLTVPPFRRGDANGDGSVDIGDPIFLLGFFFTGGSRPPCVTAGDANDDGAVDIGDPIFILAYLFDPLASPPPPPFPTCGADPTPDSPSLGCVPVTGCP